MNTCRSIIGLFSLLTFLAVSSVEAAVVAYPKKGQTEKRQSADKSNCATWATKETGIDPSVLQSQAEAAGQAPQGGAVRGAGKGAAVGALGGAIGGDAGKGAAIGAGVGAAAGVGKKAKQKHAQEAATAQVQQQVETYETAVKTCLKEKGYSVS